MSDLFLNGGDSYFFGKGRVKIHCQGLSLPGQWCPQCPQHQVSFGFLL